MTRRAELVDLVNREVLRVLTAFEGSPEEYAWLYTTYGVTEEEDVRWCNVLSWEQGFFESDVLEDDELAAMEPFLKDDDAVIAFLEGLLAKYRSITPTLPAETAAGW